MRFSMDATKAAAMNANEAVDLELFGIEPRNRRGSPHNGSPASQKSGSRGTRIAPSVASEHRDVARWRDGDGWGVLEMVPAAHPEVVYEYGRTLITGVRSPDVSFERVINPYYVQPCHIQGDCGVNGSGHRNHAIAGTVLDLNGGRRLLTTMGAATLLAKELASPRYQVKSLAIGTQTDPYHPVERTERVTRSILEVLAKANHPIGIITKSALVLRDLDLIAPMARKGLVKVAMSITTLNPELARRLEPRASAPDRRLHAIEELSNAGVPVTAMLAPIIPALNDAEIELVLTRARARGAREAGYVMLRLPPNMQDLFAAWLLAHYPDKHRHVMTLVRSMAKRPAVKAADPRVEGSETIGPLAWTIGRRFQTAMAKNGYATDRAKVRTDLFTRPTAVGEQLSLAF